jgi:hypothetical protein
MSADDFTVIGWFCVEKIKNKVSAVFLEIATLSRKLVSAFR